MILGHPLAGGAALGAAAVVTLVLYYASRTRTAGVIGYSNLEFLVEAVKPNPWIERILTLLFVAGLCTIAISFADPYVTVPRPVTRLDVAICIDTSGSMQSADIAPTRAQAALASVRTLVSELPRDARIELIAFAATAETIQPFTTDRVAVAHALANVPEPNGATAIGDAFALVRQHFSGRPLYVLLLTDGVNNRGRDPIAEANALAVLGVRIETIGIGTTFGDVMSGTSERAGMDAAALRTYARISHGTYHSAASASSMRDTLLELGTNIAFVQRPVDLSYFFSILGATLAIVGTVTAFISGRVL